MIRRATRDNANCVSTGQELTDRAINGQQDGFTRRRNASDGGGVD